jgi:hypothetical protein
MIFCCTISFTPTKEGTNDQSINQSINNYYTVGNYYIYCCSISIFICFIILFIDIHLFTLTFKWNTRTAHKDVNYIICIYIYIFFVVISLEIHNIMYDVVYFNFYSIPFHCFSFSLKFIFTLLFFLNFLW